MPGSHKEGGGGGAPSGSGDPHAAAQELRVDAWGPIRQRSASYEDSNPASVPPASTLESSENQHAEAVHSEVADIDAGLLYCTEC